MAASECLSHAQRIYIYKYTYIYISKTDSLIVRILGGAVALMQVQQKSQDLVESQERSPLCDEGLLPRARGLRWRRKSS